MADSQPPEGLRQIIERAIADPAEFVEDEPYGTVAKWASYAVLAALFEACEVREDFPMTYTTTHSKREQTVVHAVREGAAANARMYAQDDLTPTKVEHRWTLRYSQPVMRIDSDGEVPDPPRSPVLSDSSEATR